MGRMTAGAGAVLIGMMVLAGGCASSDEPTSLLLSEAEMASAPTLGVGDAAPPLVAREWVRGGPISSFEPGRVYVIDFWTSWCGPCVAIMEELAELQEKQRAAGVTVIAVTALDGMNPRREVLAAMETYAKGSPASFAIDGGPEGNATVQAYLHAARETGVPRTFVVDGAGRVAWIGHPERAAGVVESVVAGTWDMGTAAAARERETRERTASRELVERWGGAKERGDTDEQLRLLRELTAMEPENVSMSPSFWLQGEKVALLRQMGDIAGAREAFAEGMARPEFTKEPWALAHFVYSMESLDPALTDPVALRAEEMATTRDARRPARRWEAFIAEAERPWDTQARQVLSEYWFGRGDRERAVALITKALADTDRAYPLAVKMREELLRKYEQAP